jgi:hypothetical protein
MSGWIGVDLDGTLAHYDGSREAKHIGAPIPAMLARVIKWIEEGREVRIFTARASDPEQVPNVRAWLRRYGLPDLAITNIKDFSMVELWDDRCVQVQPNAGIPVVDQAARRDVHASGAARTTDKPNPTGEEDTARAGLGHTKFGPRPESV